MANFDFITYMLTCARELKDILHTDDEKRFFRITGLTQLEELLYDLPDACFPAIMVENNMNGNLTDRSPSDNMIDIPYYSFMVLGKAAFADHDLVEETKKACKTTGMKIIARMIHDKRIMANGLTFLNVSSIAYTTFGPIADDTYGVSFSFTVSDQASVTYDSTDWQTDV